MSLERLIKSHPWSRYSRKLVERIISPHCSGYFKDGYSEDNLRLLSASEGHLKDGNIVKIYWLVDQDDGQVVDARFQVFGCSALIGAAEGACQLSVGKNYLQAGRLSATLIDSFFCDDNEEQAFPEETSSYLNMVIDVLSKLAQQCEDIEVEANFLMPDVEESVTENQEYPGWDVLSYDQKIAVIESVLDKDVRPYIALDGGGVQVVDLIDDRELVITYQGACVSCLYATGATLSHIQQVVTSKVSKNIIVVPKF